MRLLLTLAATASIAACTSGPGGTQGLAGTAWRVTAIDGAAPAVPDKARLTFESDRHGANVGCNGMGGDYRIDKGRLIAGPLMATRMFCEGPVWGQEEAVGALLAGAPRLSRSGDRLLLQTGGHSMEAVRAK